MTFIYIYIYIIYISHSLRNFPVADYIKYLSYLLFWSYYLYIYIERERERFPHYFPITTLSTFPVGGNPCNDFRQSVLWRTLPMCDQMFDTELESMTLAVGGRRLDDSLSHRSPDGRLRIEKLDFKWNISVGQQPFSLSICTW